MMQNMGGDWVDQLTPEEKINFEKTTGLPEGGLETMKAYAQQALDAEQKTAFKYVSATANQRAGYFNPDNGDFVPIDDATRISTNSDGITTFQSPTGAVAISQNFGNTDNLPKVQSRTESSLGGGIVTGYGSSYWKPGLDFVLSEKNGGVSIPFKFKVMATSENNGGFGKQVQIIDERGNITWFSHLSAVNYDGLQEAQGSGGEWFEPGLVIGNQGNTGSVIPSAGGDGTHLDITMPKGDGGYYTAEEVAAYWGVGAGAPTETVSQFGSSENVPTGFRAQVNTSVNNLQEGETWGTVFDRMKQLFPEVPNDLIDSSLGGFEYNGKQWKWNEGGAWEAWKAKTKTTSGGLSGPPDASGL